MSNDRINYLLEQYLADKASATETAELKKIISEDDQAAAVTASLEQFIDKTSTPEWKAERLEELVEEVLKVDRVGNEYRSLSIVRDNKPLITVWRRIAVAASVLLIVGLGSYFMFFNKADKPAIVARTTEAIDVKPPQANRAMVTLANGQQVYLDSAVNGKLLQENGVEIVKLADGKISYKIFGEVQDDQPVYNTLSNPRGSNIIDMTLADGSRVWLNAGSSITYPIAFVGNERRVSINGEAYFEVAQLTKSTSLRDRKRMPFIVEKGDMQVQVLGTHFNVNAYDDEADIKVTLLEGSVKTSMVNGQSAILKPGDQAIIKNRSDGGQQTAFRIQQPDLDGVMAWKNGLFSFDHSDLPTVMRQIARWYDVDVMYEGAIPNRKFGGEISRMNNVSRVLKVLEESGIRFKQEKGKIIIAR
jgi:transmembrane sensor